MTDPIRERRDVERNREAILSAAIAVLTDAPQATMHDIAVASGVGRSTLYRHYPDRAALIEAIHVRVRDEAGAVLHAHLDAADDRDPIEVLIGLTNAITDIGEGYRFLERRDAATHAKDPDEPRHRGEPLRRYIADAQRAGTIRTDLDSQWLFTMLAHTFMGAIEHRFSDPASRRAAIAATIRGLLAPPAGASAERREGS